MTDHSENNLPDSQLLKWVSAVVHLVSWFRVHILRAPLDSVWSPCYLVARSLCSCLLTACQSAVKACGCREYPAIGLVEVSLDTLSVHGV